jgi:hypothetical protein
VERNVHYYVKIYLHGIEDTDRVAEVDGSNADSEDESDEEALLDTRTLGFL